MAKKTLTALRALADKPVPGPLNARLEAAIDADTDEVLRALGEEMGGRSKAARYLLREGARAVLAERTPSA